MRVVLLLIAIALLVVNSGRTAKPSKAISVIATPVASSSPDTKPRIDFDTQIKPILQSKCMPCHFTGGQVYERLPFDKPATIRKLGARLFTRIKDKNETRLIEEFLSQTP